MTTLTTRPSPEQPPERKPGRPPGRAIAPADLRAFLRPVLRRPASMGAVTPTSAAMASAAATIVPATGEPVVVELGAGTGAISDAISARLSPAARHLAIEIDPGLVAHLRRTRAGVDVIEGDATELLAHLADASCSQADAIVSSLPWTLLSADQQSLLLREIGKALKPGGAFTAIGYLTAAPTRARRFQRRLQEQFDEVLLGQVVWRNVPPARVYVCRRPWST